jgi:hypothetical protein
MIGKRGFGAPASVFTPVEVVIAAAALVGVRGVGAAQSSGPSDLKSLSVRTELVWSAVFLRQPIG